METQKALKLTGIKKVLKLTDMKTQETKTYILSTTGNYLILPNLTLVQEGYETPRGNYDSVWLTTEPINLEKAWETIDQLIQRFTKYNYIGDDDYYDYLPDLFNQYLQLAYQKSPEDYQKAWKQITENPTIKEWYSEDPSIKALIKTLYSEDPENPLQVFLDTPEEIREDLSTLL